MEDLNKFIRPSSGQPFSSSGWHPASLTLPLSTKVSSQPFFAEFQSSLVLGHLQQLHGSSLIRSISCHLTNDVSDEFSTEGLSPLPPGGTRFSSVLGHFVTFLQANGQVVTNRHPFGDPIWRKKSPM